MIYKIKEDEECVYFCIRYCERKFILKENFEVLLVDWKFGENRIYIWDMMVVLVGVIGNNLMKGDNFKRNGFLMNKDKEYLVKYVDYERFIMNVIGNGFILVFDEDGNIFYKDDVKLMCMKEDNFDDLMKLVKE